MKKFHRKSRLLAVIALLLALTAMAQLLTGCGKTPLGPPPNQNATMPATDFTVYDAEGNPVKLSDFLGTPVVLNFWASWCGPCCREMPDFHEAFHAYGDAVQFVMINLTDGNRETVNTAQSFLTQQGYTFPVFFDTDYSAARAYNVTSIPTTYFIDAAGNVVAQATGAINAETLQAGIDRILGS